LTNDVISVRRPFLAFVPDPAMLPGLEVEVEVPPLPAVPVEAELLELLLLLLDPAARLGLAPMLPVPTAPVETSTAFFLLLLLTMIMAFLTQLTAGLS
jgi:hypothetical protein